MKRKTFTWRSLSVLFVAACMVAACSGDEGEPGPAGTNGTNGTDGKDVAYEEAISRGNVLLILDGKRPDGVAFKDTVDFRFSTDWTASTLYRDNAPTDDDNQVYLRRRQFVDIQLGEGEYGVLNSNSGGYLQDGEESVYTSINAYYPTITFPQEKKYFQLYVSFYFERYFDTESEQFVENGNLVNGKVNSYKRIVGTDGKFSYNISGTVPAENNNTGYDLNVTVVADVLVYEQLRNNNSDRVGSSKSNGRTAPAIETVAKAEMKSMK